MSLENKAEKIQRMLREGKSRQEIKDATGASGFYIYQQAKALGMKPFKRGRKPGWSMVNSLRVLEMHGKGLTFAEIGRNLKISRQAVSARIQNVRKQIEQGKV